MQQNNYVEAEEAYRRALLLAADNNKMCNCNLGICLMKQGRIGEAKENLRRVKPAVVDGPRGVDSHLKAYERAQQMLGDLESEMMNKSVDRVEQSKLFDAFLGSSAIWQPQPCKESRSTTGGGGFPAMLSAKAIFGDENVNTANIAANRMPQKNGVVEFVPKKWKGIKCLHLKFSDSLALPIYEDWEGMMRCGFEAESDSFGKEAEEPKKMTCASSIGNSAACSRTPTQQHRHQQI